MAINNTDEKNFQAKPAAEVGLSNEERKQLGAAKKLWRIEVLFHEHHQNNVCRYFMDNQTSQEVLTFREKIFSIGLMVMMRPGEWLIAPPSAIVQATVYRQDKFFTVQ